METIKLVLPEYKNGLLQEYKLLFISWAASLFILLYLKLFLLIVVSFPLIIILVRHLMKSKAKEYIVYQDLNNKETLLAEIREIPFFGAYLHETTSFSWEDIDSVSILASQSRPVNFFLRISGNNYFVKSFYNKQIEYLKSDGRIYWEAMHRIILNKANEYNFKLEVTELFDYIKS